MFVFLIIILPFHQGTRSQWWKGINGVHRRGAKPYIFQELELLCKMAPSPQLQSHLQLGSLALGAANGSEGKAEGQLYTGVQASDKLYILLSF